MHSMIWVLVLSAIYLLVPAGAHPQESSDDEQEIAVGIDEKLGDLIPLQATFTDKNGAVVRLGDIITRPTIVSLVYYRCPSICKPLLSGVAEVLGKLDMKPGEDYDVVTISFDPGDTSEDSKRMEKNYITGVGKPFPEGGWRFLTGDSANIALITDGVGFRYKRSGEGFAHAGGLIVLSPEGKISRYLYGITFLTFDLKLALLEASQGKVSPTIAKVLLYCFSYDSEGKRYVLSVTRVGGIGVLTLVFIFVSFMLLHKRSRRGAS
jgi:protein SCO1/2